MKMADRPMAKNLSYVAVTSVTTVVVLLGLSHIIPFLWYDPRNCTYVLRQSALSFILILTASLVYFGKAAGRRIAIVFLTLYMAFQVLLAAGMLAVWYTPPRLSCGDAVFPLTANTILHYFPWFVWYSVAMASMRAMVALGVRMSLSDTRITSNILR